MGFQPNDSTDTNPGYRKTSNAVSIIELDKSEPTSFI